MSRSDLVEIADPGIREFIDNYFELMWSQDMALFDLVFHTGSALYSSQNGELSVRTHAFYKDQMLNRVSPKDLGNVRKDSVLAFDQLSPNQAMLKVQLQMFGGVMQDYLNIGLIDGKWIIMSKVWDRVGDAV
jgi:hypothetical protein